MYVCYEFVRTHLCVRFTPLTASIMYISSLHQIYILRYYICDILTLYMLNHHIIYFTLRYCVCYVCHVMLYYTYYITICSITGVNWLSWNWWNRRSCILADEMGLGKTIQSTCFLQRLRSLKCTKVRGPFILVAPLSLIRYGITKKTVSLFLWTTLPRCIYCRCHIILYYILICYYYFFSSTFSKLLDILFSFYLFFSVSGRVKLVYGLLR